MVFQTSNHQVHSKKWTFFHPHRSSPVCFACLVEILEDTSSLTVQKRPTLAEILQLLQHPEFVDALQSNFDLAMHISCLLMGLLESDDSSFASSVIEVFLKILCKLDSHDLLVGIMNYIIKQLEKNENLDQMLPMVILLGRMVKTFPPLPAVLCQEYESVLYHMLNILSSPDEELQSNVVFFFVYAFVGPWETMIPVNIQQSLAQEVVCLLHSAKSHNLLRNLMDTYARYWKKGSFKYEGKYDGALLRNLVSSSKMTHTLMTFDVNSLTLLSSLKKLVICKNTDLQRSAVHVISGIVSHQADIYCDAVLNSDIVEFMFEALHTQNVDQLKFVLKCIELLCQRDQFYSKCHSIYGLESVLYVVDYLTEIKNYDLMKMALDILSSILSKQPIGVPLFLNSGTVTTCLTTIKKAVQQNNPSVFYSAINTLRTMIQKQHLLLPVPSENLRDILIMLSERMMQNFTRTSSSCLTDRKLEEPMEPYLSVWIACTKLVDDCQDEPSACVTSFISPDSQQSQTSLQQFTDFIVHTCLENVVPLTVRSLEKGENTVMFKLLLRLFTSLNMFDENTCTQILLQLMSAGFLTTVINYRVKDKDTDEYKSFILMLCHILHDNDQSQMTFPDWIEGGIQQLNYRLKDFLHTAAQHVDIVTGNIYIFFVYHMCRLDDVVLSAEDVLLMVNSYIDRCGSTELSPLIKKYLVFLWAFASSLLENSLTKTVPAFSFILNVMSEEPPKVWYTNHIAFLYWTFLDHDVCTQSGSNIIRSWLNVITEGETENLEEYVEFCPDIQPVYQLFSEETFTDAFMQMFVSTSSRVILITSAILKSFLCKITDAEMSGNFILFVRDKSKLLLQEIFHNEDSTLYSIQLKGILSVLLMTYDDIESAAFDSLDLKVFYHVSKWLCMEKTEDEDNTELCLKLLLVYTEVPDIMSNRVLPLIIQNTELLKVLSKVMHSDSERVRAYTFGIVSGLVEFSSLSDEISCAIITNFRDKHIPIGTAVTGCVRVINFMLSPIKILIQLCPLESKLRLKSSFLLQHTLRFLEVVLRCKFDSRIVTFPHLGRYPADYNSPLVSSDFKILFCYLQQFMLKECSKTKQNAVHCFKALAKYLRAVDDALLRNMLRNPWNAFLTEIVVQMTEDNVESIASSLTFLQIFLESEYAHQIIMDSSKLILIITSFLKEQESSTYFRSLEDQYKIVSGKFYGILPQSYSQSLSQLSISPVN